MGGELSLDQKKVLGEQGQLGRGPTRRNQANSKDYNPSLGQSRAGPAWDSGAATVSVLEEVVSSKEQQGGAESGVLWGSSLIQWSRDSTWVPQMSWLSREAIVARLRLGQAQQGVFGAQE